MKLINKMLIAIGKIISCCFVFVLAMHFSISIWLDAYNRLLLSIDNHYHSYYEHEMMLLFCDYYDCRFDLGDVAVMLLPLLNCVVAIIVCVQIIDTKIKIN